MSKPWFILSTLLVILVGLSISTVSPVAASGTVVPQSPALIVNTFYARYIALLDDGVFAHPLLDGAIQRSSILTAHFAAELDALVSEAASDHHAVDPVLCGVDTVFVNALPLRVEGSTATVAIVANGQGLPFAEVSLVQQDDQWLIDGIVCTQ